MPQRDEELHQIVTVLDQDHICDVIGVTKVPLAFCCPLWTEEK